jgi:hypothetical protein
MYLTGAKSGRCLTYHIAVVPSGKSINIANDTSIPAKRLH